MKTTSIRTGPSPQRRVHRRSCYENPNMACQDQGDIRATPVRGYRTRDLRYRQQWTTERPQIYAGSNGRHRDPRSIQAAMDDRETRDLYRQPWTTERPEIYTGSNGRQRDPSPIQAAMDDRETRDLYRQQWTTKRPETYTGSNGRQRDLGRELCEAENNWEKG
ncbi:hypothetical protein LSAT2_019446, partial [Lamellibrachia satsuma]